MKFVCIDNHYFELDEKSLKARICEDGFLSVFMVHPFSMSNEIKPIWIKLYTRKNGVRFNVYSQKTKAKNLKILTGEPHPNFIFKITKTVIH